ncbi:MAG: helix-turn-helix transcriptional regulator [Rhodobacteraceae bacterium]|nr:helix-turn-helix transcriptional regulator [Paracoccaceae bacterium]
MLTAEQSKVISSELSELVNRALEVQGISARAVSIEVVGHDGLIRDIRAGRIPSYDRIVTLFDFLGIDLPSNKKFGSISDPASLNSSKNQTLPHHGMATCSTQGWADDNIQREPISRPTWVADDSAFWVSTTGTSMVQEGIRAGDFCITSPGRAPRVGDRVWMKEASSDGRVAIKRLTRLTADRAYLRGWLPPLNGVQNSFDEERPLAGLAAMHPIIGVYRGQFGKKGVDVEYVHDPRKGSDARQDGLVPVSLLDAGRSGKDFPVAMGFSDDWLSTHGLKFDQVALVGMADDHMSPAIPKGAVTLVDLGKRKIEGKGIYAIRKGGSVQVRRLELIGETLLITGDSDNSESVLIPKPQRGTVEILGRVVWSGNSVSIEK